MKPSSITFALPAAFTYVLGLVAFPAAGNLVFSRMVALFCRHIFSRTSGRFISFVARRRNDWRSQEASRPKSANTFIVLHVLGQVVVYRLAEATDVRVMDWEDMDPVQAEKIQRAIQADCRAIIITDLKGTP